MRRNPVCGNKKFDNAAEVGKSDFDMNEINARWKKQTALGFFWLALTGFLATTGGRKRKLSMFTKAKTTPTKHFGFLETTAKDHFTEAPSEDLKQTTSTDETLGK